MEIINENKKIKLRWKHQIHRRERVLKNPSRTVNVSYASTFPESLRQYIGVLDKLYFYKDNEVVYISSREPRGTEYKGIKLQSNNLYSIPRTFFNPEGYTEVILTLDLGGRDRFWSGIGAVSMKLK